MQNLSLKKLLSPKSLSPSSSTKLTKKNKTEFMSMKKVDQKSKTLSSSDISSSTSLLNTMNSPETPEEPTSSKSNKSEQSSTVYILDEEEDIF